MRSATLVAVLALAMLGCDYERVEESRTEEARFDVTPDATADHGNLGTDEWAQQQHKCILSGGDPTF